MKLTIRAGAYYFTDATSGRQVRGFVHNLYPRYCGKAIVPVTEKSHAWKLATEIFEAIHQPAAKRHKSPVEAIREYVNHRAAQGVSVVHAANLRSNLLRFSIKSGLQSVNEITEAIITRYLEDLAVHPHTKNKHLSAIQGFCKFAKKQNWLQSVPTRDIERYPERDPRVGRMISKEELDKLRAETDPFFAAIITFAVATGLRRGEIMHLWRSKWQGLDLDRGEYSLPAEATKARRAILNPLSSEAVSVARDMMRLAPKAVWGANAFTHKFYDLCKRLGIKARFHDLRHTFNARLGQLQLSPGTRARLMNQSTPDLSESRYHHDSIEYLHQVIQKLPRIA